MKPPVSRPKFHFGNIKHTIYITNNLDVRGVYRSASVHAEQAELCVVYDAEHNEVTHYVSATADGITAPRGYTIKTYPLTRIGERTRPKTASYKD